jgi:amino acid adenylation domain-containing protein/thioester reductase-like protein
VILERFRAIAAAHPSKVAIEDGDRAFTFAEVLGHATALGARFRAAGIGPGDAVGILLEPSAETVIAMLAAWSARAAFVPLDPELPRERLDHIVRDAGVRIIVARPREAERVRGGAVAIVAPITDVVTGDRWDDLREDDTAYVIYTSGTTGVPKGVVVPHRGLVNVLTAQIAAFALDPTSRALLYLSTSFDASISDIGTALLAGATLCIDPGARASIPSLLRVLRERAITHVDLPPSLLGMIDPGAAPPSLAAIVIGGEVCPPAAVRAWAARVRLVNVYGPTEATICASLCVCDGAWDRPLIGRPIPGVTFHVLDDRLGVAPVGVPGELYIGGVGLARGYRSRPDLTAAKWIVRDGERLYRTGDRVVRRDGGDVEFLGRIDRQLKVRGLLVEPEEIEARLCAHPGVRDAAVVKRAIARIGRAARDELVAFVTAKDGADLAPEALRASLAALPRWMHPHRIEALASLPRTSTGKIDLGALASRPLSSRAPSPIVGGSRGALLAAIWADVLGVAAVGDDDDFVALGGDSLAALEIAASAEAHGIGLVASDLFRHPTIARLAARTGATDARRARDLRADVTGLVPPVAHSGDPAERPRAIFVTGATGFLGARLVKELLARTDAVIHCLVRARSDAEGAARVGIASDRVRIVCGDLERESFGLSDAAWTALAAEIDAVYHLAARVSVVLPYADLRAANVLGTREALRLASEGRPKRMHHASTLSVFVAADRAPAVLRFDEHDTLRDTTSVHGGYAQTKWAAEVLLHEARRAVPVAIYRLGQLTGLASTRGGRLDTFSLFVRGIAALGCVPEGIDPRASVDVTPVDYAASAMAALSLGAARARPDATFHIAGPAPASVAQVIAAIRAAGAPIAIVPPDAFRARAVARGGDPLARACAYLSLCRASTDAGAYERHRALDLFQATGVTFAEDETRRGLAGSGVEPEALDASLAAHVASVLAGPERQPMEDACAAPPG